MSSLIRMIVLVVLLISTTLISSLIDHSNYENSFKKNINYSDTGYFNNKKVVDSLIRGKELSDLINTNEFKKVEKELEKIKSIRNINVYRNTNLELQIDIIDREPIALLIELNSYLDSSGVIIKKDDLAYDSLPEIKGVIAESDINKIVKVVTELKQDNFFQNKLELIKFKEGDIYINIKNFDFDIRLGNEFHLKNKLNMLKGFYMYQSNNLINEKYKQIDLVYNNRLIAIKK